MRTFTEALQIIQEGRGMTNCPECRSSVGKDDFHDDDCDCEFDIGGKKITGYARYSYAKDKLKKEDPKAYEEHLKERAAIENKRDAEEAAKEAAKPKPKPKPYVQKPDKYGYFKREH